MERDWDNLLKKLVHQHPQAFIKWVVGEASLVKELPNELKKTQRIVDGLLEVNKEGETMVLHIEFQTYPDAKMAERLLEYNVLARRHYEKSVLSCVIYLLTGAVPTAPLHWSVPGGAWFCPFTTKAFSLGS